MKVIKLFSSIVLWHLLCYLVTKDVCSQAEFEARTVSLYSTTKMAVTNLILRLEVTTNQGFLSSNCVTKQHWEVVYFVSGSFKNVFVNDRSYLSFLCPFFLLFKTETNTIITRVVGICLPLSLVQNFTELNFCNPVELLKFAKKITSNIQWTY